jgi:hypothetical protein
MSELELENVADAPESSEPAPKDESVWQTSSKSITGVRIGTLVGISGDDLTPLVVFSGQQGSAAVAARATVDLHGNHVGREVVIMFEDGDPQLPILIGFLMPNHGVPSVFPPGHIEVEADGARLQVTARDQLVLRCGKATITLTKAGKILLQGSYVSSRSSGVNRIKGGSVQIN